MTKQGLLQWTPRGARCILRSSSLCLADTTRYRSAIGLSTYLGYSPSKSSPSPPLRGRCRKQRGVVRNFYLVLTDRPPPLSLRDISPRKGGRAEFEVAHQSPRGGRGERGIGARRTDPGRRPSFDLRSQGCGLTLAKGRDGRSRGSCVALGSVPGARVRLLRRPTG